MTLMPRIRQAFALVILGAVLVALWMFAVSPVAARLAADRQELASARMQLAHTEELVRLAPLMQEQLAQLRTAHDSRQMFLSGDDPTLLSAQFQQSVQQIVSGSGAEVGSSRTLAARHESQFIKVSLQLELATSAAGLDRLLYDIETALPLIVVDHLAVQVSESGVTDTDRTGGQPNLNISMELAAYAKPHGAGFPL